MKRCVRHLALGAPLAFATSSCDFGGGGGPDASTEPDALACFEGEPPAGAEESGAVEIGTGGSEYEPVEEDDELTLWLGFQGGYHFDVRPRIRGLHPGDPEDNQSPDNPHTLLAAYDEDGERLDLHGCGFQLPYRGEDGDYDDFGSARRLMFSREVGETLEGERVRIEVSVLDREGRYAQSDVWIIGGEIRSE